MKIFLFLLVLSTVVRSENFPSLTAETIQGEDLKIPEGFKNKTNWVIVGFTKDSSKATSLCADKFEKDRPGEMYSIAVLQGVPFFVKGLVKNGIRSSTPENRKNRFLFLFEGKDELQKLLDFDSKAEDDAYVFALKGSTLIFKSHGNCDEAHYKLLKAAVAKSS